jgi:taurine dioxygenase
MRFQPLHEGFGAEVIGIDLMSETRPEDIDALVEGFDRFQLLLIRNQAPIPPERQVQIAGWFGECVDSTGGRSWGTMDNENPAGSIRLSFHSDLTYTDSPVKAISLHALELPAAGASTAYVSGVHAWATLPADRQEVIAPFTLRHTYTSQLSSEMPRFEADHPVRLHHPRTGQPVLLVTEMHADRIYELDVEESDRLLAELKAHIYSPHNIYVHHWQRYDLVVWDNLAVQHARTDQADIADGRRLLQRVALNEVPYEELIRRARDKQHNRELQGA